MGRKRKVVNQEDIATATGLDQGSVSRILAHEYRYNDSFLPETIEKVIEIALRMGYRNPSFDLTRLEVKRIQRRINEGRLVYGNSVK